MKVVPRFFYALFSRMEIKEILENTLRKEPNLLSDKGEIKKWIVINKAQNYDETLLGLLLDEPRLKTLFFKEVKNALVFNLNLFTDFIEQKEFLPDSYTGFPNKIGLQSKPSINPIFQYLYRFTTFVKIQYTHDKGN